MCNGWIHVSWPELANGSEQGRPLGDGRAHPKKGGRFRFFRRGGPGESGGDVGARGFGTGPICQGSASPNAFAQGPEVPGSPRGGSRWDRWGDRGVARNPSVATGHRGLRGEPALIGRRRRGTGSQPDAPHIRRRSRKKSPAAAATDVTRRQNSKWQTAIPALPRLR